ncbi:PKD-like family lipoprotein [Solitalea sp. MAHUQ-68]|uniref:PKD-like family lipoprotein n=1 Tax=Solitalea agri TaxID=2953739 RepID=A0A9X2F5V4_9SPHI|nr:PKD-like family lipoprotein [Solitalea agri]MCO4292443.1 PKD-like family lipoprotein [Solitalea agri]
MKPRYTTFFSLLALFLLGACSKDLGNYNYTDVNKVTIEGVEKEYTAKVASQFVVQPTLLATLNPISAEPADTSSYSYEWACYLSNTKNIIGKSKNLDYTVNLLPGNYPVVYTITDRNTGIAFIQKFNLRVENDISSGWLVLSDVDQASRLDMVNFVNMQPTVHIDVLKKTGSELKLKGKPRGVYFFSYQSNATNAIYIFTSEQSTRLFNQTLRWQTIYDLSYQISSEMVNNGIGDYLYPESNTTSYLVTDKELQYNVLLGSNLRAYGTHVNYYADGTGKLVKFNVSPYVANFNVSSGPYAIVYDTEARQFLRHVNLASQCVTMPAPTGLPSVDAGAGVEFDPQNVGKDLVYMTATSVGIDKRYCTAVMKDPANGKYSLIRFELSNTGTPLITQAYNKEFSVDANIAQAEKFAVHPATGRLFYSVGSKLYMFDLASSQSKLVLDKGTSKISMIKFNNFENESTTSNGTTVFRQFFGKLLVASYDPAKSSESNGTLETYQVPDLFSGDLVQEQSYSGFGKIVSVTYKER